MAPANLAAVLVLAVLVCAFAAAPTAANYSGGAPAQESCPTQIQYFTNCLARDEIREQCCTVVDNHNCLCLLKRQVEVPCRLHRHHQRKCGPIAEPAPPKVKLAELQHLPCFKDLKC